MSKYLLAGIAGYLMGMKHKYLRRCLYSRSLRRHAGKLIRMMW